MDPTAGGSPDIAAVAALLGDRSRAAMVTELSDGRLLPASELARLAGVSRSTASEHLARLTGSGLLAARRCGRHTYYQLATPEVATALEALAAIAGSPRPTSLRSVRRGEALAKARLCYDHLAGRLGVAIADALSEQGLIQDSDGNFVVECAAWDASAPLDVTCPDGRHNRPLVRACVDWTVRRYHLAGILGALLTRAMFERGWLTRIRPDHRAVQVTDAGFDGLRAVFGIDCTKLDADEYGQATIRV